MRKIATEFQECKAFFQWALLNPLIRDILIHIPNEGKRSLSTGSHYKLIGLRSGVSDYYLPLPSRKGHHGLWIELKRVSGSKTTDSQLKWIDKMRNLGYAAEIAYGAKQAIDIVIEYLK